MKKKFKLIVCFVLVLNWTSPTHAASVNGKSLECDLRLPVATVYNAERTLKVHSLFVCMRHANGHAVLHGTAQPMIGNYRFPSANGAPYLQLVLKDIEGETVQQHDAFLRSLS